MPDCATAARLDPATLGQQKGFDGHCIASVPLPPRSWLLGTWSMDPHSSHSAAVQCSPGLFR
eukprot:6492590-Alexandrium_andersonii.AAC.1